MFKNELKKWLYTHKTVNLSCGHIYSINCSKPTQIKFFSRLIHSEIMIELTTFLQPCISVDFCRKTQNRIKTCFTLILHQQSLYLFEPLPLRN